ncbi:hypothetical protein [Laspinema palackyanum]|uniref:hypothetical protein n=1 Tax=Laspinema palackyanum TaxID=3231601 RepID=UPI00345C784C|nr:hypothetical protein [Laspinema sp. D2c]
MNVQTLMTNDQGLNSESSPRFISPGLPPRFMAENPPADRPIRLGIMASGSGSNFEAIAQRITP